MVAVVQHSVPFQCRKSGQEVGLGSLPVAPPTDSPHEYEALKKYQDDTYEQVEQPCSPTDDYQLSTCAAYVSNTETK